MKYILTANKAIDEKAYIIQQEFNGKYKPLRFITNDCCDLTRDKRKTYYLFISINTIKDLIRLQEICESSLKLTILKINNEIYPAIEICNDEWE